MLTFKQFLMEMHQSGPSFNVIRRDGGFLAVDENTYDGAVDGNNYMGSGSTEEEALHDLIVNLEDSGLYNWDVLEQAMHEYLDIMERGNMDQVRRDGIQDERNR